MSNLALPLGADPRILARRIASAHEDFLVGSGSRALPNAVRSVVRESWARSAGSGVDPDRAAATLGLSGSSLDEYRRAHPLASVLPLIRALLVADAEETGHIVAVTDAAGLLLWVEGSKRLLAQAEHINFAPGACWGEAVAGTNAPGVALATDRPVQVFAAEHFTRPVQPWSCSAAPIHDPATGALLGAIDLTGGDHIAAPHTLALVKATAAAAEAQLRLQPSPGRRRPRALAIRPGPRLAVLGRDHGRFRVGGVDQRLSLRHAELLLILSRHPRGLNADELAVRISEADGALVTVRAELSRLRRALGDELLESRPYRLKARMTTDVDEVVDALRRGAVRRALDAYEGPVLPRSQAPEIERLRAELAGELRAAVRHCTSPEVVLRYLDTVDRDDLELTEHALRLLPPRAPRRAELEARAALLELELAAT